MPEVVIKKVDEFSERDKAKIGVMFRNRFKENFDFKNEEYTHMPNENAEIGNEIYPDIPAEFPRMHIERDDEMGNIKDPQADDELNREAAEAENCDLAEVLVAIGRESEQQNDEMIRETDVDDPKQVNL